MINKMPTKIGKPRYLCVIISSILSEPDLSFLNGFLKVSFKAPVMNAYLESVIIVSLFSFISVSIFLIHAQWFFLFQYNSYNPIIVHEHEGPFQVTSVKENVKIFYR
jgi:hypothetical protein